MFLYWIDKQRLAGSSEPLLEDFPFLKTIEWGGIVCLQEKSSSEEIASLLSIPFLHLPIENSIIPTEIELETILEFYNESQKENIDLPVLIHCSTGYKLSGTILAAILVVVSQYKPEDAIDQVRKVNPLAIENKKQEDFIKSLKLD